MWVMTRLGINNILQCQGQSTVGLGQGLGNASIALLGALIAPTVDSVIGDITEPTYGGYARQALAGWTLPPFTAPGGFSYIQAAALQFRPTTNGNPDIAYGQALLGTDSIGVFLKGVEIFDEPLPMSGTGNQLTTIVRVGLSPTANYGLSVVSA